MPPRVRLLERTSVFSFVHRVAARGGISRLEVVPVLLGHIEHLPNPYDALVCVSDLQGVAPDAPEELSGIRCAQEIALWLESEGLAPQRTLVLLAGDFYSSPGATTRGASGEVDSVWQAWGLLFGTVVGVAGNHDRFHAGFASIQASNCHLLDGNATQLNGLSIAGWGGVVTPYSPTHSRIKVRQDLQRQRHLWSEEQFVQSWRYVRRTSPHIVLVHETPLWPGNEIGSAVVRARLEEDARLGCSPKLIVSGHVRWQQPYHTLGDGSQVLACDGRIFVLKRV